MPHRLDERPIHLGLGATAEVEPPMTGMEWYAAYGARHAADGAEGRLVTMHRMSGPWTDWERHPNGAEVVLCIEGQLTLIQEIDGAHVRTTLQAGEYAINAPGVWHTADIEGEATAVFVTAGEATDHRPRES